jgi:hypothetical protein
MGKIAEALRANLRELARWADIGAWAWAAYGVVVAVCLAAGLGPVWSARREPAATTEAP